MVLQRKTKQKKKTTCIPPVLSHLGKGCRELKEGKKEGRKERRVQSFLRVSPRTQCAQDAKFQPRTFPTSYTPLGCSPETDPKPQFPDPDPGGPSPEPGRGEAGREGAGLKIRRAVNKPGPARPGRRTVRGARPPVPSARQLRGSSFQRSARASERAAQLSPPSSPPARPARARAHTRTHARERTHVHARAHTESRPVARGRGRGRGRRLDPTSRAPRPGQGRQAGPGRAGRGSWGEAGAGREFGAGRGGGLRYLRLPGAARGRGRSAGPGRARRSSFTRLRPAPPPRAGRRRARPTAPGGKEPRGLLRSDSRRQVHARRLRSPPSGRKPAPVSGRSRLVVTPRPRTPAPRPHHPTRRRLAGPAPPRRGHAHTQRPRPPRATTPPVASLWPRPAPPRPRLQRRSSGRRLLPGSGAFSN